MKTNRRGFISQLAAISAGAYAGLPRTGLAQADVLTSDRNLPNITHGVWAGDVSADSAIICARADRPSQMVVEVASNESFRNARKYHGPNVLSHSDFVGKAILSELPAGEQIFYRVVFRDLDDLKKYSAPTIGTLRTPSIEAKDIRFAWSGDTAGQGFGIDEAHGGMKTYETIRKMQPDFFVHSGDTCYADNPFPSEMKLDDGSIWKNLVTEETSKVAETLDEFRANHRYNLLDENVRRMNAEVPTFYQWDDHEVVNNWYPGERLEDDRYTVKSASLLAARSRQAFFDYLPVRSGGARQTIYRSFSYGALLDLFFLDQRSYRAPNSTNRQEKPSWNTTWMGARQLNWLKESLRKSKATWKVISSDMPIGMMVGDGDHFENCANGDGPVLGREFEVAELLKFIKDNQIQNVLFITADVHHAASHYYDPNEAQFQDFEPFWEFVTGPLHAGTFGPAKMDNTFGPQVRFMSLPEGMKQNRPPSEGLQFFGLVDIDSQTKVMTVAHYNRDGDKLWSVDIEPKE